MKTIKSQKRLSLGRETLVNLTREQLGIANGGASIAIRCNATYTCQGPCYPRADDTSLCTTQK